MSKDPLEVLKDHLSDIREALRKQLDLKLKEKDPVKEKTIQDRINQLDDERKKVEREITRLSLGSAQGNANPKPASESIKDVEDLFGGKAAAQYSKEHPEARAQLERIRAALRGEKKPTKDEKTVKQTIDTQKKIAQQQLQNLKKETGGAFSGGKFSLPQFTADNSTTVVLVCILIIFGLELHAGTKFVTLWNDAFSPGTKTVTTTPPQATQNHDNAQPDTFPALQDIGQNLDAITTNPVTGTTAMGPGTYLESVYW